MRVNSRNSKVAAVRTVVHFELRHCTTLFGRIPCQPTRLTQQPMRPEHQTQALFRPPKFRVRGLGCRGLETEG